MAKAALSYNKAAQDEEILQGEALIFTKHEPVQEKVKSLSFISVLLISHDERRWSF
jgi:hypothetical protein